MKLVLSRVFAITQADAAASPSVVTGQLPGNNLLFTVLFDSGATRSYVATRVIDLLGRPCDILERWFGTLMISGKYFREN